MNSRNCVHKTAVEDGRRAAFIVLAALAATVPLQSQQLAIGHSEYSGPMSLPTSVVVKEAQQVEKDSSATKRRIAQPAELPTGPTVLLEGSPQAVPSSSPGNPDPQPTEPHLSGQSPAPNNDHILTGAFFHRLVQFYSQDWAGTNPAGPSETKRGLLPALDSPPFPFSDWGYGGAPDIGAPDGNTYPLMSALNLENSRTKVYGWVAGSFNFSTSAKNNFPVSYDIFPNKIQLNQAVVYIERLPDTVQTSHFDWGYHVTGFYGIDYRFTTAKGYFSQQLLQSNKQYGLRSCSGVFRLLLPD